MLTNQTLAAVKAQYTPLQQNLTLYHRTTNATFYSKLCLKSGFGSYLLFRGAYLLQQLGGNAVYGPGIYLSSNNNEVNYGNLLVRFDIEANTNYLDLYGPAGVQVCQNANAVRWHVLADERIDALIRVTAQWYVLRTPHNMVITAL